MRIDRPKKGTSIIDNPNNFIVVDLETTGFSTEYDSILEIAAIKISDGHIIDVFNTFVNYRDDPTEVPKFITDLTGITQNNIDSAPYIDDILPTFLNFIGDSIILGHNVSFDINFLYDVLMEYYEKPFSNNFIDTIRFFRKLHPELKHHRLKDMVQFYNIETDKFHRSVPDCENTYECFKFMLLEIDNIFNDFDSFKSLFEKHRNKLSSKDITAENTTFDETHPIYGKVCVFTGTLDSMPRKEAMQLVVNLGGINKDSVTKSTNFLILGDLAYCKTVKGGKSSKQKKAEKLKLEGQDIEVINESTFLDMINE